VLYYQIGKRGVMGLLFGLALTAGLICGIYAVIFRPGERSKILKEWGKNPIESIVILALAVFCMIFLWGILIPPFGQLRVHVGEVQLELWQVGVLASLAGFIIHLVWDGVRRR
jgi:hypothetical protein